MQRAPFTIRVDGCPETKFNGIYKRTTGGDKSPPQYKKESRTEGNMIFEYEKGSGGSWTLCGEGTSSKKVEFRLRSHILLNDGDKQIKNGEFWRRKNPLVGWEKEKGSESDDEDDQDANQMVVGTENQVT